MVKLHQHTHDGDLYDHQVGNPSLPHQLAVTRLFGPPHHAHVTIFAKNSPNDISADMSRQSVIKMPLPQLLLTEWANQIFCFLGGAPPPLIYLLLFCWWLSFWSIIFEAESESSRLLALGSVRIYSLEVSHFSMGPPKMQKQGLVAPIAQVNNI